LISTIYIEDEIRDHERTREICERFSHATQIPCDRYTSVFNSNSQNFRLQKKQPSLILAKKHKNRVLETPAGYGIGSENNYYFSHMMNCLYDCRYCFLQGARGLEHKVPSVSKRIAALAKLQQHGWQVGLRLDPLIITAQFVAQYRTLLDQIFASVNAGQIHSVSYGAFRLPKPFFKKMVTLYPAERLFATNLTESDSMVSYSPSAEQECLEQIRAMLLEHVPENVLYPCS